MHTETMKGGSLSLKTEVSVNGSQSGGFRERIEKDAFSFEISVDG